MAKQGYNEKTKELVLVFTIADVQSAVQREEEDKTLTINAELADRLMKECENDLIEHLMEDWSDRIVSALEEYIEESDYTEVTEKENE